MTQPSNQRTVERAAKRFVMGIDFGSTTAKTVILDLQGRVVGTCVTDMGAVSDEGVKASISGALHAAGITEADVARAISTGYGRRMLEIADKSFTEITCHARGAVVLVPDARLVIDIGGQDSKVISVDANGLVAQFAMNDRCAAGTGKFLEVLARSMTLSLTSIGELALHARKKLKISSVCATFAETEVISLLAASESKADILGAVHEAIARRTLGLVSRVGKRGPVVMTGGVAKNIAAVRHIEEALGLPLQIPPDPQIVGALGAAMLALDDLRAGSKVAGTADERDPGDDERRAAGCSGSGCTGQPPPAIADPGRDQ